VLHIGERSEMLLPKDAGARARATQWLIAALNSIEPFVMNVVLIDLFYKNEEWAKLRRPGAVEFVQKRLSALSKSLGDKPYLDGDRFTAGDLMMATVLRILQHTNIVTREKRLADYVKRCTARPAFRRALDAQFGHRRNSAVVIQQSCKAKGQAMRKNTICLWYDKDAEAAARFYAATFPDSAVSSVFHAPSDYPGGKKGDVLTVDFTVLGIPCLGLNGGPVFKHNEAFSFQIATEDQAETDRYWNAIVGNGGQESQCGWCKDKWGISWQITPRVLTDALAAGGDEAKRAFAAMMGMGKIDVAAIEAARRG
jgi:predicted 3-demethylubiquinone-9 3-methyltransferase (glyoxalase superfamily)